MDIEHTPAWRLLLPMDGPPSWAFSVQLSRFSFSWTLNGNWCRWCEEGTPEDLWTGFSWTCYGNIKILQLEEYSNVIVSRIWFECLLTITNDSHFFIFIRCIAVCLVNDRSFMTFNCRAGIGPQSYRNRQQSVQAIMTAMWNDITAGVASTVTCLLHFLELGLELTHQGKSDLVKGDQRSY